MIAGTVAATEEDFVDALAEEVMSPGFARALEAQWLKARSPLAMRLPEIAYTEEVATPSLFPFFEMIAITTERERGATMATVEISIQVTVNGTDFQDMGREVKRYAAAVRQYFNGRSLAPIAGSAPAQIGRTDFSPITARKGEADFMKTAAIAVFFDTVA